MRNQMAEASRFRDKSERRTFWRDMAITLVIGVTIFIINFIL